MSKLGEGRERPPINLVLASLLKKVSQCLAIVQLYELVRYHDSIMPLPLYYLIMGQTTPIHGHISNKTQIHTLGSTFDF